MKTVPRAGSSPSGRRLARPDRRLDGDLKVLDIGRGPLVQDHEIDRELPRQYSCASQQLTDHLHVLDIVDPNKDDGNVAGDPVRPKPGLGAGAFADRLRRRPQPRVRVDDMAGQTLKIARLVGLHPQMAELHLAPGSRRGRGLARTRCGPDACRRGRGVRHATTPGSSRRRRARSCRARSRCGGGARRRDRAPSDCVRSACRRVWRPHHRGAAPADEAGDRFDLDVSDRDTFNHGEMGGPYPARSAIAGAASRRSLRIREGTRFDEHLREGGCALSAAAVASTISA